MHQLNKKGFTLIELLIVIAIIAIIAGAVFVALDPATRFKDTRDTRRWSDIATLLAAIKIDQVDNKGSYLWSIAVATSSTGFMIQSATSTTCSIPVICQTLATSTKPCINLGDLVSLGYIGSVPVSPNGSGSWSTSTTGYVLTRYATGIIKIQACEAENTTSGIFVSR